MIGKNAAELELTKGFARLHPVFNVSLLIPFLAPEESNPGTLTTLNEDFVKSFVDWAAFSYILDYRNKSPGIHEYLMRGPDLSGLNDEWRLLTTLSPHLDQFLCQFHKKTPSRGLGPDASIWEQRAATLV